MARLAVKSKPITSVAEARLVSKAFALKFLRKAFIGARIQRVALPEGTKVPPDAGGLGPMETWQVWAISNGKQQGVIEVTAPRDMLPYAVVREAFKNRLNMDVRATVIKGGVNLTAEPFPPPPEVVKAMEDALKKAQEAEGEKANTALLAAMDKLDEQQNPIGGLTPEAREEIRESARKAGTVVVFKDELP